MVLAGYGNGPSEPLNSIRNSSVVRGNYDPVDQRGPFDAAVNVLYQRLSVDFDYRFSGETSGVEPGGDDRDGGIDLHQNTALHLSTSMADRAGPLWQKTCTELA